MKLVTGTVVDGKVTLPEGVFEEGSAVAVLGGDPAESVPLTAAEEAGLSESLKDIREGRYVEGSDLVARLKSRGR